MIRVTLAGITTALTLTIAAPASAQDPPEGQGKHHFGAPGFIISADRLLPLLSYESSKVTFPDGSTDTQSKTSIALLNNGPFGTFYNLPRLGFDWLPIQNLTLGVSTWLYTQLSASDTLTPASGASKSNDMPKVTYWGVAPRVGYIIPIGHTLSFWPRVGGGFQKVSSSSVNGSASQSQSQLSVTGEALLVISPWNHFGFQVGPTVDVPLSGKRSVESVSGAGGATTTTTEVDSALFQVGISAGMLGHF